MEATRSTEETKMNKIEGSHQDRQQSRQKVSHESGFELVRQPCLVVSSFGTQQAEREQ